MVEENLHLASPERIQQLFGYKIEIVIDDSAIARQHWDSMTRNAQILASLATKFTDDGKIGLKFANRNEGETLHVAGEGTGGLVVSGLSTDQAFHTLFQDPPEKSATKKVGQAIGGEKLIYIVLVAGSSVEDGLVHRVKEAAKSNKARFQFVAFEEELLKGLRKTIDSSVPGVDATANYEISKEILQRRFGHSSEPDWAIKVLMGPMDSWFDVADDYEDQPYYLPFMVACLILLGLSICVIIATRVLRNWAHQFDEVTWMDEAWNEYDEGVPADRCLSGSIIEMAFGKPLDQIRKPSLSTTPFSKYVEGDLPLEDLESPTPPVQVHPPKTGAGEGEVVVPTRQARKLTSSPDSPMPQSPAKRQASFVGAA